MPWEEKDGNEQPFHGGHHGGHFWKKSSQKGKKVPKDIHARNRQDLKFARQKAFQLTH